MLGVGRPITHCIGIVAHEVEHAAAEHLAREGLHVREPGVDRPRYVVARASGDGVVELTADEGAPRELEQRAPVSPRSRPSPGTAGECGEWLRASLQEQLGRRAATLERRPGRVHALECPGIAVRPTQLARQGRRLGAVGCRLKELIEPRDPERALRLDLGEQVAQARHVGVGGVVIRADEHGNVLPGRAPDEPGSHRAPRRGQPVAVSGERRSDLVPRRREVPHQGVPPVGAAPAVQVALLSRLPSQAPPHHTRPDAELAGQGGPHRWMTERIRRIQHVEPAAEPLGIRRAEQQVAHQRFARGDELIGEHVPRTDLQAPRLDEGPDLGLLLRARAQVVGDEYGLAIEQEAAVARVRLQPLEQVIQRGDEPRLKRGARQIPLAVPVGVRDEMKDEPAHWRVSLRGLRLPCYTLHYKVLLDTD